MNTYALFIIIDINKYTFKYLSVKTVNSQFKFKLILDLIIIIFHKKWAVVTLNSILQILGLYPKDNKSWQMKTLIFLCSLTASVMMNSTSSFSSGHWEETCIEKKLVLRIKLCWEQIYVENKFVLRASLQTMEEFAWREAQETKSS